MLGTAVAVLLVGLATALLMSPERCGMDDFECSPNGLRITVTVVSLVLAAVIATLSSTPSETAQRLDEKERRRSQT
jgi:hypothetical protein